MSKERTYGFDGYKCLADDLGRAMRGDCSSVPGIDEAPFIRAMKRFSSQALAKAFASINFDQKIIGADISTDVAADIPHVHLTVWDSSGIKIRDQKEFQLALVKVFGRYASSVDLSGGSWVSYTITLSDSYLQDSGQTNRKRRLSSVMKDLLKKHDIGGIKLIWVDAVTRGHRIKIEGAEIIDDESMAEFEQDLRDIFGDDFKKFKTDGEISGIGYRPVGPGLTNYRIFLGDMKGKYLIS